MDIIRVIIFLNTFFWSIHYSIYCIIMSNNVLIFFPLFVWYFTMPHIFKKSLCEWIVPKVFNTKQGDFPIEKGQKMQFSYSMFMIFELFSQVWCFVWLLLLSHLKCWLWMPTGLYFRPQPLRLCAELQWICGEGDSITTSIWHLLELKLDM